MYNKVTKADIDTLLLGKDSSEVENESSEITDCIDDVFNSPEVNLRVMMASFYIGSGPHDVGSVLSFENTRRTFLA